MNEMNFGEKKGESSVGKKHISINIGLLAGLFGGGILGIFIGAMAHDIPLYTGFGMLIGMAISFDMTTHMKHKEEKNGKNDEMRE